jgi:hypothetical protein
MTKPLLIATAVGSLAVGFGVGYKIAGKRLAAEFDNRLLKETEGMREFYQVAKKPFATPQEAAAQLIGETQVEEAGDRPADEVNSKIAYHKIVKTNYQPQEDPEEELAIVAEMGPPVEEHNLFIEEPHIITQEEFMQNDSEYIQSTLTFYKIDNVLTDERENVIEELNETVGAKNMVKFGNNSSDPNVVHIRNGRLQMEFEVCLSDNSYRQAVMGMEEEPPDLPSGRKRS